MIEEGDNSFFIIIIMLGILIGITIYNDNFVDDCSSVTSDIKMSENMYGNNVYIVDIIDKEKIDHIGPIVFYKYKIKLKSLNENNKFEYLYIARNKYSNRVVNYQYGGTKDMFIKSVIENFDFSKNSNRKSLTNK